MVRQLNWRAAGVRTPQCCGHFCFVQGRGVACVYFTICIRAGQVGRMKGVNGLLQILGPQKNGGPVQPHAPWARACYVIKISALQPSSDDSDAVAFTL